jgi:quinolinate synthase
LYSDSQLQMNKPIGLDVNKLEISQMIDRNIELAEETLRLERQRGAVVFAHKHQRGEVQEG